MAKYETVGEKTPFENLPSINCTDKMNEAVYPLNVRGIAIPIYISRSKPLH